MRRVVTGFISIVCVVTMLAGPGLADSGFTVRGDPNEKNVRALDIRRVITHVGENAVLVRVGFWGRFVPPQRVRVWLDTNGSPAVDFLIRMQTCEVSKLPLGRPHSIVGRAPGGRLQRDVLCRIPMKWLRIDKPVQFVVKTVTGDRAPNRGSYVGF